MSFESSSNRANLERRLTEQLCKRKNEDNHRTLALPNQKLIDFSSNDYLGLAQLTPCFLEGAVSFSRGAGAARLLRGHNAEFEELEREIAKFFCAEAALFFSSGYLANLALFSCLPKRDDVVLFDASAHASIKDGVRLSSARHFSFKHNCLEDLEAKMRRCANSCWIALEGLYSMDGDFADLEQIGKLAEAYGAQIIVDEAHSAGLFGQGAAGLACISGLDEVLAARVVTFGKAFGSSGAAVLGSKTLVDFLINFSRPFIYTTAASPAQLALVKEGLSLVAKAKEERAALISLTCELKQLAKDLGLELCGSDNSPIRGLIIPGAARVKALARQTQNAGFDVRAICYPTVPEGKERIRIVLHSFNTPEELRKLLYALLDGLSHKEPWETMREEYSLPA